MSLYDRLASMPEEHYYCCQSAWIYENMDTSSVKLDTQANESGMYISNFHQHDLLYKHGSI